MSAGPECQQLYALNLRLHLRRARRDGVSNRSVVEMATKRKAHNAANGDAFGAGRTVNLGNLRIINDRFVLDVCSGTFHRLSETAAFILAELQRRRRWLCSFPRMRSATTYRRPSPSVMSNCF